MEQLPNNFFLKKNITCPVCLTPFPGRVVNPRLYAADIREEDRHVTRYTWAQGIQTAILPHHYEIWHCPTCFFSALHNEFELTVTTVRHKTRWSLYRQLDAATQIRIRSLAKQIDLSLPYDEITVTTMHALAIWIHNLVPEEQKSWMDLGRLYLRLAWLYREYPLMADKGEADRQDAGQTVQKMQELAAAISQSLQTLHEQFSSLRQLIELRHRETGRDTYTTLIDSLDQKLHALDISERTFNQVLQRDLHHQLPGDAHSSTRPPLAGLSSQIGQLYEACPRSEAEATLACVDAFDKGIRLGDGGDLSIDAQLTVIVTNIRLLERIGDFRRALQYITEVSKMAYSEKQDLSRKLKESEKTGQGMDARRPLIRQLNSVSAVVQNLSDLRDHLTTALIEQEGQTLPDRLRAAPSRSEQLKILDELRIPDPAFRFLEEKGWLMKQ